MPDSQDSSSSSSEEEEEGEGEGEEEGKKENTATTVPAFKFNLPDSQDSSSSSEEEEEEGIVNKSDCNPRYYNSDGNGNEVIILDTETEVAGDVMALQQCDDDDDDDDDDNDDEHCCVCLHRGSPDDNPIIFCDGACGMAAHRHCALLDQVPSGEYFCDGCEATRRKVYPPVRCILCSKRSGFMLRAHSKHYFHPMCANWTAELDCGNDGRGLNVVSLDKNRKYLTCTGCKQSGGAVVECAHGDCRVSYHPNCAYRNQHLLVVWGNHLGRRCDLYCFEHAAKAHEDGAADSLPFFASNIPVNGMHKIDEGIGDIRQNTTLSDSPVLADTQLSSQKSPSTAWQALAGVRATRGGGKTGRVRKRLRKTGGGEEEDEEASNWTEEQRKAIRLAQRRARRQQSKKMAGRFFEEEASLSGSDSCDDEEIKREGGGRGETETQSSPQLSGDFINDGDYTQPAATAYDLTQSDEKDATTATKRERKKRRRNVPRDGLAMYFHVNQGLGTPSAEKKPLSRYHSREEEEEEEEEEEDSPEFNPSSRAESLSPTPAESEPLMTRRVAGQDSTDVFESQRLSHDYGSQESFGRLTRKPSPQLPKVTRNTVETDGDSTTVSKKRGKVPIGSSRGVPPAGKQGYSTQLLGSAVDADDEW